MITNIDGRQAVTLVSCHFDETFSYFNGTDWVRKAKTVPLAVINDLPENEAYRVRRKMAEWGGGPS
jgi:hypothetical protein